MSEPAFDDFVDAVVRVASIKHFVDVDNVAGALRADPDDVRAAIEQLVAAALMDDTGRMYRLSPPGRERARQLLEADQARWGIARAETALNDLHVFDGRVKTIVTRWQLREIDGAPALNDHTDEAHDRKVLVELATLHGEAGPWLDRLAAGLARLDRYRARLDHALERATSGDGRFVAGPMLDSYHTVWFELHEDLIRLAGRTREAEAAAGRA